MATKTKPDKYIYLYDKEKVAQYFSDIKIYSKKTDGCVAESKESIIDVKVNQTVSNVPEIVSSSSTSCSYCNVQFDSVPEQRVHFKLDWHRYNLKQSLVGKQFVTEDGFEKMLNDIENDEENEISASDDDDSSDSDQEDSLDRTLLQGTKIYFVSKNETILSVNKCLLLDPKARDVPSELDLVTLLQNAPRRLTWAILMLGGGHFAGAIFRGREVLVHKTFHAYTVRAKQGGSQASADNKSGSSHPKSAGASLRRYNEMSLMQHIQEIMDTWRENFNQCQLVFFRATSGNKKVLFGAKDSAIEKNDDRLRSIPFQTRRATFKEVKRVHELLNKVDVLGKLEDADTIFGRDSKKLEKSPKKKPHRSKSREEPNRPLPVAEIIDERSDDEKDNLELVTEQVSTLHLQEFGSSLDKRKKKRSKNNKGAGLQKDSEDLDSDSSDQDEVNNGDIQLKNDLLTAAKTGNNQMMETLIATFKSSETMETTLENFLNHQFGDSKTTALHIASKHSHKVLIWTLMLHGADPTVRDKLKKVPYMLAETKDTRNVFRKFAGEFPEKFDYKTAMIPPPLSKEEEDAKQAKQLEKKKAQRQAKREKEKVVKAEEKKVKEEKEEKERFLNLSDREKRALAAERRLLGGSSGISSPANITRQRCFNCGADITGKTPFEYSDNKFCSINCVKKHRKI